MNSFSEAQRLYHSRFQHDGCGVGFNSDISGSGSSKILQTGLKAVMGPAYTREVTRCARNGDWEGLWSGFQWPMRQRAYVSAGNNLRRRQELGVRVLLRGRIEESDRRQQFFCCHMGEETQMDYGLSIRPDISGISTRSVRSVCWSRSSSRKPVSQNHNSGKIQIADRSLMKSTTGNGK